MTVRLLNKERRRQRILDAARELLLEVGYDGLTTRGLADAAGVTVPTIYNLIGGKDAVLEALIIAGTEQVWEHWQAPEGPAMLDAVDDWLATCHQVIANDSDAIRAMIVASDHVAGVYSISPNPADAASGAARAMRMPTLLCERLRDGGVLAGIIAPAALGEQVFTCFRDPFRDWGQGVIDLDEFARRFARGTYMVLCADATDDAREQLVRRINSLHDERESGQNSEPVVVVQ